MSLSRREGLRCQNVTFCPLCLCAESQLNLHLLFWPFGCLKEQLLFWGLLRRLLCLLQSEETGVFFSSFLKFCSRGLTRKQAPGGILKENKNQLGHGLVTIWGAVLWRSERKEGVLRWLEWLEKAHTNQICSGVFFEDKNYGFSVKDKTFTIA